MIKTIPTEIEREHFVDVISKNIITKKDEYKELLSRISKLDDKENYALYYDFLKEKIILIENHLLGANNTNIYSVYLTKDVTELESYDLNGLLNLLCNIKKNCGLCLLGGIDTLNDSLKCSDVSLLCFSENEIEGFISQGYSLVINKEGSSSVTYSMELTLYIVNYLGFDKFNMKPLIELLFYSLYKLGKKPTVEHLSDYVFSSIEDSIIKFGLDKSELFSILKEESDNFMVLLEDDVYAAKNINGYISANLNLSRFNNTLEKIKDIESKYN